MCVFLQSVATGQDKYSSKEGKEKKRQTLCESTACQSHINNVCRQHTSCVRKLNWAIKDLKRETERKKLQPRCPLSKKCKQKSKTDYCVWVWVYDMAVDVHYCIDEHLDAKFIQ